VEPFLFPISSFLPHLAVLTKWSAESDKELVYLFREVLRRFPWNPLSHPCPLASERPQSVFFPVQVLFNIFLLRCIFVPESPLIELGLLPCAAPYLSSYQPEAPLEASTTTTPKLGPCSGQVTFMLSFSFFLFLLLYPCATATRRSYAILCGFLTRSALRQPKRRPLSWSIADFRLAPCS